MKVIFATGSKDFLRQPPKIIIISNLSTGDFGEKSFNGIVKVCRKYAIKSRGVSNEIIKVR